MPLIDDLIHKKTKKFVKKEYRPWNDESLISEMPANNETVKVNDLVTSSIDTNEIISVNFETVQKIENKNLEEKEVVSPKVGGKNPELVQTPNTSKEFNIERFARGLYGLQRLMLQTIIENISSCEGGVAITNPLTYADLSMKVKSSPNSIKTAMYRLKEAGVIEVFEYKPGKGGYTCYKVKEVIYNFFQQYFLRI